MGRLAGGKDKEKENGERGRKGRVEFSIIEGHKSSDGKFLPNIQHNFLKDPENTRIKKTTSKLSG